MAKENETITDIIARLRRPIEGENAYLTLWRDEIADRLDAAHKHEVREAEDLFRKSLKKQEDTLRDQYEALVGFSNSAKLREALENVSKQLTNATEDENFGEDVMYLVGCMRTMSRKCRAALAAPPRNCDVYNNESCRMAYHLHGDGLMTMQAFADWLYAPATEQEGCAK